MRARILFGWTALAMVAGALTSCAPLVTRFDYDPDADFAGYRTFGWMPDPEVRQAPSAAWDTPFVEKRIKQAVIGAMTSAGFAKADEGPDLLIAFRFALKQKANVRVYGYSYWGPYPPEVQRWREGTLIIDLVDARTRKLVWRGWGTGDFDALTEPGSAQRAVDAAVRKILRYYPPYRAAARHD